MQWHTGMVALSQKDVVLYRATSPMTKSSQAFPRSHGAGSFAPRGVEAEGAPPATRLRIVLGESPLVGSERCRGEGISNTWSAEDQGHPI